MSLYVHAGELPVIVDFTRFDRDSGYHNITIVANSTNGELAEWTYKFEVSGSKYIHSFDSNCTKI